MKSMYASVYVVYQSNMATEGKHCTATQVRVTRWILCGAKLEELRQAGSRGYITAAMLQVEMLWSYCQKSWEGLGVKGGGGVEILKR